MTSGTMKESDTGRKPQRRLTVTTYQELTTEDEFYRMGLWRNEALCVSLCEDEPEKYDPTDWFPLPTGIGKSARNRVPQHVAEACARCPVRLECLTYAIQTSVVEGIWAGHSHKTVRKIARRLRGK